MPWAASVLLTACMPLLFAVSWSVHLWLAAPHFSVASLLGCAFGTCYGVWQLREAADCIPSLLVLDDLQFLCPAPSDAPEAGPTGPGTAALVAWLCEALRRFHLRPNGRPPLPGDVFFPNLSSPNIGPWKISCSAK